MNPSKAKLSGILLMMQSSIAFSLMGICVKAASQTLPSLEIVFFRSLFGVLMISPLIIMKKVSFLGKERKLMTLRGFSGFTALSLYFYTIGHLPLGTAVMLNYTSPIFSAILAMLFLGERKNPFLLAMTVIAFAGVFLLVDGKLDSWNFGVFIGLLSAFFAAMAYVTIRAVKHRESPLTIIFYFTAISTVGSFFFLFFGFEWPNWKEWLLLTGVGVGSFYGQLWMTIALRRVPASLGVPFSYLTPLLSFIYGFIFFGEAITISAIIGATLIILGGSLIVRRNQRAGSQKGDKKELPRKKPNPLN